MSGEETFYFCVSGTWYKGKTNGKSEKDIKTFLSNKYPGERLQLRIGINNYEKVHKTWSTTSRLTPQEISLITPEDKEIILSIEETVFNDSAVSGYAIKTNKRIMQIGIENSQCCCEEWGYIASEDDFTQYNGAEIISVYATDKKLASIELDGITSMKACLAFFNINTSKGLLQFVMYNAHNGYYGHDCLIVIDDVVAYRENL